MDEFIKDLKVCKERFGDIKLSDLLIELTGITTVVVKDENKYFKFEANNSFRLIHLKQIVNEDRCPTIFVYDELEVINYQKVSFSSDCKSQRGYLFEDHPYEEITEDEWIKELCYYFKRVPGNDELCCP